MSPKINGVLQLLLVAIVLVAAFATSMWLASLRKDAQEVIEPQERTIVVTAQTVDPINYRIHFDATGTVQARAPVGIVPQVSGKVVDISDNFFPGGVFEKNEILFKIEQDDYKNEIERLEAEVARAQTGLDLQKAEADAAIEEWKSLHPDKKPPPLVAQKPQLNEARAILASAKAQLATARLNLKRTEFSLPFKGRITQSSIELGQYVSIGQSIGQAYSLSALEISVPLEDREFGWIMEAENPDITIRTSYLGQERILKAKVKRKGAEFDTRTRLTRMILALKETAIPMLPGVFVDVEVIGPLRENIWLIPVSALQEDNSLWVIEDDMTLKSITPDIINMTRDYVAVHSDGKPVRVVTGPLPEATQGTKVRIRKKTDR